MTSRKCACCGGENLAAGDITSTGKLYFKPADTPFLTFKTNDVKIDANMCLDCGAIGLVGEIARARQLLGQRTPPH